jgi:hypothetical protein
MEVIPSSARNLSAAHGSKQIPGLGLRLHLRSE